MSESDDRRSTNHEKAVKDWKIGKALSDEFDPKKHELKDRVAYMLRANYELFSAAGATEEDCFDYTKMDLLSSIVNKYNLELIVEIGKRDSIRELREDLKKSAIVSEAIGLKKRHK